MRAFSPRMPRIRSRVQASTSRPVRSSGRWLSVSLTDLDNLPEPDELAEEIIEDLEAGLSSFKDVLAAL